MQKAKKQLQHKGTILKTILIFLCSYIVFLLLWIQVKDYYGYGITYLASQIATGIKDVKFEEMEQQEGGIVQSTFSPVKKSNLLIDITVKTSSYTFNAPLTFAIAAALYLFIQKRTRAYIEAMLILMVVHLLYVFSLEAKEITEIFVKIRLEPLNKTGMAAYQFLWSFTDNMVIRFEPFLIGFYMFIRFRK